ncbi:MAG: hypothetical protein A2031_08255 [Deltaproteobacteria bacterium RBG_19FT_COMBO_43_11]|jgi:hypothetical protein|nr:MAG: hypothetical protein A2W27_08220 [Deltaproteobacteria bacterium RBG_16_44_11]OGP87187.1 MAG: hypothetical protein A2031_08255 [Deltaproteobacteria bacterium RBG_19FT_COMBO_43_11]
MKLDKIVLKIAIVLLKYLIKRVSNPAHYWYISQLAVAIKDTKILLETRFKKEEAGRPING